MIAVKAVTAGSSTCRPSSFSAIGQVAGAGDRQELGEPLDDAEDRAVQVADRGAHDATPAASTALGEHAQRSDPFASRSGADGATDRVVTPASA